MNSFTFIDNPIAGSSDTLAILLFQMMTSFCSGACIHFPMKKVIFASFHFFDDNFLSFLILLVLWKTLLTTLGGWDELRRLKDVKRAQCGLMPCEDTLRIARTMKASAPPSIASLVGAQSSGSLLSFAI